MPAHRRKMTKFSAILTTVALVVGFIPFGKAVCQDGEVAIGDKFEVSSTFQSSIELCRLN